MKNNDDDCCKAIAKAWDMFKDLDDEEIYDNVSDYKKSLYNRFSPDQIDRCAKQLIKYVIQKDRLPDYND